MWNPFAEPKYATGLREILPSRDVAQPGRALAWGARGRQFKSARPDHSLRGKYFCGTLLGDCRHEHPNVCRERKRAHRKRLRGVGSCGDGVASNLPVPTNMFAL